MSEGDLPRRLLLEMDVCGSMAVALATLDTQRGAGHVEHFLALAERHGEPRRLAQALALDAGYAAGAGQYRRAQRQAERAARVMAASGDESARPYLHWASGALVMFRDCAWRDALDSFRRSVAVLREHRRPSGWESATGEQFGLACRLWLGDLLPVIERVPGDMRAAELSGDSYAALGLRLRFGPLLHLWRGDGPAGENELEAALAAWHGVQRKTPIRHQGAALARADILLYVGEPERMTSHFRASVRDLASSRFARHPFALREMAHALGRVALARAAGARGTARAAALEEAARAAAVLRGAGSARAWRTLAQLLDAGRARLEGREAEARRHLESAAAALDDLEMTLHAAGARRALGLLIDGDEGAALVTAADQLLAAQSICDPARWAAVLVPTAA